MFIKLVIDVLCRRPYTYNFVNTHLLNHCDDIIRNHASKSLHVEATRRLIEV